MFGELFSWIAFLPSYLLNCHFHLYLEFFDLHSLIADAYFTRVASDMVDVLIFSGGFDYVARSACRRMIHSQKPDFPLAYLNRADDVGGMKRNYTGKPDFTLPLSLPLSGEG
jgi:hypothetical protein